jgi:hypothetical protein
MDATALGGKKALQQNKQCLELGSYSLYRSEVTAEPKVKGITSRESHHLYSTHFLFP